MMVRRLVSMGLGVLLLLTVPGVAFASWVGAGSGHAFTGAVSMPGGPTPTSSATGRTVTVNWQAVQFPDSTNVNAYVIKRYNTSDVAQTIGASCDGTITSLTCTESAVPPGIWTYTVTPKHGAWLGAEGPESVALTVDPPSMSFSSSTTLSSLPSVLSGSVSNFLLGETLTFRLDDPSSGTILSGSVTPSSIPGQRHIGHHGDHPGPRIGRKSHGVRDRFARLPGVQDHHRAAARRHRAHRVSRWSSPSPREASAGSSNRVARTRSRQPHRPGLADQRPVHRPRERERDHDREPRTSRSVSARTRSKGSTTPTAARSRPRTTRLPPARRTSRSRRPTSPAT